MTSCRASRAGSLTPGSRPEHSSSATATSSASAPRSSRERPPHFAPEPSSSVSSSADHQPAFWGRLGLVADDSSRERLASTFDQAAALYQRARPDYPTELYDR